MVLSLLQYKRIRQRRIRKVLRFAQIPVVRAISGLDQIEFKNHFALHQPQSFISSSTKSKEIFLATSATVITKAILAISLAKYFWQSHISNTVELNSSAEATVFLEEILYLVFQRNICTFSQGKLFAAFSNTFATLNAL